MTKPKKKLKKKLEVSFPTSKNLINIFIIDNQTIICAPAKIIAGAFFMNFKKVIDDIKKSYNKHKTKSKIKKYHSSGDIIYSRLYGYRRINDKIVIDEKEAKIINLVFSLFIQNKTPQQIKMILDSKNIRNRSGNRWTTREIIKLIRPVFAGYIHTKSGKLIPSKHYEPIITLKEYELAKKSLKSMNLWTESLEITS